MTIPTSFLYSNAAGVELYDRITQLESYYLYRVEERLIRNRADEIASALPIGCTVVEIGCGNGRKIAPVLARGGFDYVANDVSSDFLDIVKVWYRQHVNGVRVKAWCADAFDPSLPWPRADVVVEGDGPVALAWLGSSLGNLADTRAIQAQLRQWIEKLQPEAIILGYDLWSTRGHKKNRVRAAYDNDLTAAFIRNGFRNFCSHEGCPYPVENDYSVRIDDGCVTMGLVVHDAFVPVEISRKFISQDMAAMWQGIGLQETEICIDEENEYAIAVLVPGV